MGSQAKSRLGRPPLPPGDTRCKRVVTFVTRSEMGRLHNMCAENGSTLSSVCHRIITEYLTKTPAGALDQLGVSHDSES
jgi:hypothetical protein